MLWLVARAAVQSMTIDEADTYLAFVAPPFATQWSAAANNQLLNSLLMRLFTGIFGAGHLALRAPALIGAAIYIAAAYRICALLTPDAVLQWGTFVGLVYNPFVMDYLVAARGYSLALGFWLAAVAILAHGAAESRISPKLCVCASVYAGLSFVANFSFTFVDAATILALWWSPGRRDPKLLARCVLPGMGITLLLAGSMLFKWPSGQLTAGAHAVGEAARSILASSLYEPNDFLVSPPLYKLLRNFGKWLPVALAAACLFQLVLMLRKRRELPKFPVALAAVAAGILAIAAAAHWLMFRLADIPLPEDRTAVFFAPLIVVLAAALAAVPVPSRVLKIVLLATGAYFLCCLRLTYIRDWKFDADTEDLYWVLAYYNHQYGVQDVMTEWRYVAALNYYRTRSGQESLHEFEGVIPPFRGEQDVNVLYYPDEQDFIRAHGLKIVYYGRRSDAVVAIRPEVERRAAGAAYRGGRAGPGERVQAPD